MRERRISDREPLLRLLLGTAGVVLTLGAAELAMHAIETWRGPILPGGTRTAAFSIADPVLGWRHRADFAQRYGWPEHPRGHVRIVTNNLGLREDVPTSTKPPPALRRVLVLGDSQTDGLVDNSESWPNVLERVGAPDLGPWEVLNAGVTGYQPAHYLLWWQTLGKNLEPDLVLLGYYLGNDLRTGSEALGLTVDDAASAADREPPAPAAREPGKRTLRDWVLAIRHRCRVCALASLVGHRTLLDGPTYEEAMFVATTGEQGRSYLAAARHCLGCLWQSVEQQWRVAADPGSYERHREATEELLARLRDEIHAAGAELMVVVIPSKLQIEPAARTTAQETATMLGLPEIDPPLEDRLEADLLSMLERLGIPSLEVRSALAQMHARWGRPLYYDGDWHLNVEGSRVVGEAVAKALRGGLHASEAERS